MYEVRWNDDLRGIKILKVSVNDEICSTVASKYT